MRRELEQKLVALRRSHPSWLLLASPKSPLIMASLKGLMEVNPHGVEFEDAVERLATVFGEYANDSEFDLSDDCALSARRELRQWIKRGLIVERDGMILATDAFQRSLQFLESLDNQAMTSTASRLATVQRAIESLESQLSHNQQERERSLQLRIDGLLKELQAVQAGEFEVLDGVKAEEGIREVYQLAASLQADFRRVEDSFREADRLLRHRIISENQNRGQIVDELLNGHDALVRTVEGQVFESFYAQLVKVAELEDMKSRLRAILENSNSERALQRKQKAELRQLVSRLLQESQRVIQARARSERDVRSFIKSGLADEQMRVGSLLQEILQTALDVDWSSQKVRRTSSPLPPLAVSLNNLPLIERLLVKQVEQTGADDLHLETAEADLTAMDAEFWQAYNALNRAALYSETVNHLTASGRPLTIGELANALPPTHDLETIAYWLAMARQAGIEIDEQVETIELHDEVAGRTQFTVPAVKLNFEKINELELGSLE
jgi:hypothetical protein